MSSNIEKGRYSNKYEEKVTGQSFSKWLDKLDNSWIAKQPKWVIGTGLTAAGMMGVFIVQTVINSNVNIRKNVEEISQDVDTFELKNNQDKKVLDLRPIIEKMKNNKKKTEDSIKNSLQSDEAFGTDDKRIMNQDD